jgi:site-specific recombinase XerD
MKDRSLFALVQKFLLVHLKSTRGLSQNSIESYRDTLRLFFTFVATTKRKKTSRVTLDDFSSDIVLDFLEHSELMRKNKARTRNHRLALLRVFFSYLQMHDEERAGNYEKILLISSKNDSSPPIECLEPKEMNAIFSAIDRASQKGIRDHALLLLMYNTGARVQEVCDLKLGSFDFAGTPRVTLTGKGDKSRIIPLWEKTCAALKEYWGGRDGDENAPVFLNPQGAPLTRHGVADILRRHAEVAMKTCPSLQKKRISPHVIRHTTATHLLQSGVDLTVIRAWLGHVSTNTTHKYIDIDLKMKQAALSKKKPPQLRRELRKVLEKNRDVVAWLKEME